MRDFFCTGICGGRLKVMSSCQSELVEDFMIMVHEHFDRLNVTIELEIVDNSRGFRQAQCDKKIINDFLENSHTIIYLLQSVPRG